MASITLIAGILRLFGLAHRGLIYWDEGKYALEGIRVQALGRHVFDPSTYILAGKAVGSARPGHALLIGFSYLVLGVHDYSGPVLNAVFSTLAVVLTFLIARRLFDVRTALIASLILAVSQYDSIYARSALPESDSTALLLVGVLIWLRGSTCGSSGFGLSLGSGWVRPFSAAIVMGFAFTTNFRQFVYIAIFVALDLYFALRDHGLRSVFRRGLAWAAGLSFFPLLWEVVARVTTGHGIHLFLGEMHTLNKSYLAQALFDLRQRSGGFHVDPISNFLWYAVREGPLVAVLTLSSAYLTYRARSRSWAIPAGVFFGGYLLYALAPFSFPRNLAAAIPFASILAAASLIHLVGKIAEPAIHRRALALSLLAVGILGSCLTWRLTYLSSGFAKAAAQVNHQNQGRALVGNEVVLFYFRGSGARCTALHVPSSASELGPYIKAGYTYAVLDRHHENRTTAFIRRHARLLGRYFGTEPPLPLESLIASENTELPGLHTPWEYVEVYRIDDLRLPARQYTVPACSRDVVV